VRPCLVFVRHTQFGDRAFPHAAELPPDFLNQETIDKLLDSGRLREYGERRSLYRLLHVFSRCSEREPLTDEEIRMFAVPSIQHGRCRAPHMPDDLSRPAGHTGCTLI